MSGAASIEALLKAEASLDRAFLVSVGAVVAQLGWIVCQLLLQLFDRPWTNVVTWILLACMFGAYLWFAVEVGRSARCVGRNGLLFGLWTAGAPLFAIAVMVADLERLALVFGLSPIHLKFLGVLIAVSPLSLKFILASELRSEIHDRTFAD